jgi:hypothetical protein
MRNLLHRIADAIKREPAAFQQIDRSSRFVDLPRTQQDHELDSGRAPQR